MVRPFQPNWASKPGNTIVDWMKENNRTVESMAFEMGITTEKLNEVIDGRAPINWAIASGLSYVTGASPGFWLLRQKQYSESVIRLGI